jgi:L-fucose isomerase-like protein
VSGILGESDVAAMLADLAQAGGGVTVTLGTATTTGLLNHEAMEILGGEMPGVVAADDVVHVRSGVLPGLASGASITVDGTEFKVMQVFPYDDGAMVRIALRTP